MRALGYIGEISADRNPSPLQYDAQPFYFMRNHRCSMSPNVHLLARAVIEDDRYFLLAHQIGASNTFLPGGHVEPGEGIRFGLLRELREELGMTAEVRGYIGAVEHSWHDEAGEQYEINHCFEVSSPQLSRGVQPLSHESHLEFIWVHVSELEEQNLLPVPMRRLLAGHRQSAFDPWWASTLED